MIFPVFSLIVAIVAQDFARRISEGFVPTVLKVNSPVSLVLAHEISDVGILES